MARITTGPKGHISIRFELTDSREKVRELNDMVIRFNSLLDQLQAMDFQECDDEGTHTLEERGWFNGTDDPLLDDEIERGQVFQDRLDMFRNEY